MVPPMATRKKPKPKVKKKTIAKKPVAKKKAKTKAKAKPAPKAKRKTAPKAKRKTAPKKSPVFEEAATQKVPVAEVLGDIEEQLALDLLIDR